MVRNFWNSTNDSRRPGRGTVRGVQGLCPQSFRHGGDRCPIFFYKIYRAHRPQAMNHDEAPFYLTPKGDPLCSKNVQGIWYAAMAMGVNSITKIAPTMAKDSGITAKITNHSLRKTLCQILYSAHVDPTVIIQLSGHKNVNSVLNYATADMEQQQDMSEILSYTTARKRRPEKPRELPPLRKRRPKLHHLPHWMTLGCLRWKKLHKKWPKCPRVTQW